MDERTRYARFIGELFPDPEPQQPFAWQADLAERLVDGALPDQIVVPTGLGKTRVIATWVYALARQLERERSGGAPRDLPLRLSFVVDRRLIVDAAHSEAEEIARRLATAPEGSVAAEIAAALRPAGEGPPLRVQAMRGGYTWDAVWLDEPHVPAVIIATVDQFGSRMLFRGYGTSERLAPIDAALVATDSWLVVDEAHLARALLDTARLVRRHQRGPVAERCRFHVTEMSATVSPGVEALRADLDRETDPSLSLPRAAATAARRLEVEKPAVLLNLAYLSGSRRTWSSKVKILGKDLADLAVRLHSAGGITAVIANTIAGARASHEHLQSKGCEAILLIGRCREREKQMILAEYLDQIKSGAQQHASDLFVVATQTIEVGADLDFDCLVTEAAPLSSLTQRFGRVNRAGARPPHRSVVVYAPVAHDKDPVYGASTQATWALLTEEVAEVTVTGRSQLGDALAAAVDAVPFDIRATIRRADRARGRPDIEPQPIFIPVATASHFDRWAATSPRPLQDVDVAPFLRGSQQRQDDVNVVWRVRPPRLTSGSETEVRRRAWASWLRIQPPRARESVTVPLAEVRRFLADRPNEPVTADIELMAPGAGDWEGTDEVAVDAVIWQGTESGVQIVERVDQVRPGAWLVVDAAYGGHDRWGWTGRPGSPVRDIGDEETRLWRWDPRLVDPGGARSDEDASLFPASMWTSEDGVPDLDREREWLVDVARVLGLGDGAVGELAVTWEPLLGDGEDELDTAGTTILVPVVRRRSERPSAVALSDETATGTAFSATPPTLSEHGRAVGERARMFAEAIGLEPALGEAVALAGGWHDVGKADPRFQAALNGGDPAPPGQPRAKSGIDPRSRAAAVARRAAGVPPGFRHEAVSARLVDELIAAHRIESTLDPELIRHLVVSHHGRARPLLPPLSDRSAPDVEVDVDGVSVRCAGATSQVDWDQPARFERLNHRYGWWGLALLEAVVRLADMTVSKEGG